MDFPSRDQAYDVTVPSRRAVSRSAWLRTSTTASCWIHRLEPALLETRTKARAPESGDQAGTAFPTQVAPRLGAINTVRGPPRAGSVAMPVLPKASVLPSGDQLMLQLPPASRRVGTPAAGWTTTPRRLRYATRVPSGERAGSPF